MYIYTKPHAPLPGDPEGADPDARRQEDHSPPSGPAAPLSLPPSSGASIPTSVAPQPAPPGRTVKSRRGSFPLTFPFPPLFQQNTSSTSLASSTAEGKPIPLDDNTAAHRTSALQKLNSTYPSAVRRHRYAKSTGAQSSTYSQPVLVRTYSGPPPPQTAHSARSGRHRPPSSSRGGSRRVPLPSSSRAGITNPSSGKPTQPALSGIGPGTSSGSHGQSTGENGSRRYPLIMPRHKPKKSSSKLPIPLPVSLPLPWHWQSASRDDGVTLPPLEAFSFKSFMADMQTQGGDDDIAADLDRIAEICARSRYSLSNQYEVHMTPHGSGMAFATGGGSSASGQRRRSHAHSVAGPTLQAFNSEDDESTGRSHRKRRSGGRRRSVAYGTLETIMSSSRSSEEDKTKKKPAAEIAGDVRGRASRKAWDSSTGSGSKSGSTAGGQSARNGTTSGTGDAEQGPTATLARKKSASFATALIDGGRGSGKSDTPSALVSEPSLPQTSSSHLGVRTAHSARFSDGSPQKNRSPSPQNAQQLEVHLADDLPHQEDPNAPSGGLHGSWSAWVPWRASLKADTEGSKTRDTPSHAAGSLRQLLKSADVPLDKGKAVDREG